MRAFQSVLGGSAVWFFASAVAVGQEGLGPVIVQTADHQRIEALLVSLEAGLVKLSNAASLKTGDLFRIDWPGQPVSADPAGENVILFANGDRLFVRPRHMTAELLEGEWLRFGAWPPLRVPLESLRACVFQIPVSGTERTRLLARLMQPAEKTDVLFLRNGDALSGEFQSLQDGSLAFKASTGATNLGVVTASALSFNPELTLVRPLKGEAALLTFTDGSRLHVREAHVTPLRTLTCKTLFGAALDVPLSAVSSLQFVGGRMTYLSDLTPASEQTQPYLSVAWPSQRDRNVSGGPLRVRGIEYAKGLGVHSRSEITWKLGGYRRFQATVGIDDETDGQGSVLFRVLLDGKVAFASKELTGRSDAVAIDPIDVSQAKTLTLVVEYATKGDILDHANWCDARLVK